MAKYNEDEDYEIIPVGPVRKLEERIKKLEREKESTSYHGFMREVLDLVQSNQRLVDEIVKANDDLRDELSKIPGKIDELLEAWKEFINLLKESSGEGETGAQSEKLDELIEVNREMVEAMKSSKRSFSRESEGSRKYPKIRLKR